MNSASYDTLSTSKDLQKAGLEPAQAEAIAMAIQKGLGDLATKSDINWFKWVVSFHVAISFTGFGAILLK